MKKKKLAAGSSYCCRCLFDFARHVSNSALLIGLEYSRAGKKLPAAEQEPAPRSRADKFL